MAKTTTRRKLSSKPARSGRKPAAPKANTVNARLREVAGKATFREVGEMTGTHPENARRYLQTGSVGLKFFRTFCNVYNVRADWLLEGTGQKNRK